MGVLRPGNVAAVDSLVAFAAAAVASGFFVQLVLAHVRRPRAHVAAWSAAVFMYAAATWALFAGLQFGWSNLSFRVFYLFGAVLNVVFLGLGSVYLAFGHRAGGVLLVVFSAFGAGAGAVTFGADLLAALPAGGVPTGSTLFPEPDSIASPRLWAVVGNAVGTLLVAGPVLATVVRFRRTNRRLVAGNLLLLAGILSPVLGGALTALGEGGGLALSLLVGAGLLWAGFRMATSARAR